ncbi:MAG: hypothetical protein AB8B87_05510 [Granulosicoccus sp.]
MIIPLNHTLFTRLALVTSLVLVNACSSSDSNSDGNDNPPLADPGSTSYGYVFTRGPKFESGQIERLSLTDGNTIDSTYPATSSDHRVATDGESIYQIGRFNIDNLTKFSATDTSITNYQLSVLGDVTGTSNPQALAFVDENLAYLTRRSSDRLLILDPSPEDATSESLITGEISLADYNLGSGETLDLPDMTNAVIVDDKLFVLLENLDGFAPINGGYIAVIDTNTNTEIDTGQGEFPRRGIALDTVNPTALHYNETTGLLYVTGRGNAFSNPSAPGDPYTGGIESIDPRTYQTTLVLDDGTEEDNKGFFSEAIVINDSIGYVITLDGFTSDFISINNLRTFNPTTGELSEPIAGTEEQSLTMLASGPDNHLWVGIQSDTPGFMRVDLTTGLPAEQMVATGQIPADMVFLQVDR